MNHASIETVLAFILKSVWRASWQASLLAALVLLIQTLFARELGGRGRYLLWSIVLLRLLLPVVPQSKLSVFNLSLKSETPKTEETGNLKSDISNSPVVLQSASIAAEPSPGVPGERVGVADLLPRAILVVWLLGMAALLMSVLRECLRTRGLVRRLCDISDARIHCIVESCGRSLTLRRLPRILSGESIQTPAVVGLWRPALLLPSRVLAQCDREQISMIVMHELAHLKRHDIATNWLVTIATVIHWFNPLVWLIAARIRADRELACDELVLSRAGNSGGNIQTYGNTLLALAELLSPALQQRQLVGILESSAPLERRIRMIARFDPKSSGRWAWPVVILLVLGVAFLTDAVNGQGRGRRSGAPVTPASQPAETPAPLSDDDVNRQMNRVLPEVNLNNVAFSDVMEFMRDVSSMNIVVDWRALENAGIDRNAQVTLKLRNVSFAQAFDHIMRSIGGGANYHVESGAIVVTTSNAIPPEQPRKEIMPVETAFYDVSDLVDNSLGAQENDARMKGLRDAIHNTLLTHMREGENTGMMTVESFARKLIVTTTEEHQQEVKHILAKLREKPATRPQAASQ